MVNKKWAVFDMETDSFDGAAVQPFIYGWMLDTGDYFFTYNYVEFVSWLKSFDGVALAHNGGKFDTVLLAAEFNIDSDIKIINGRVAEVQIGLATVRDSFLIIPAPLSAGGEKDDFDYAILDRRYKELRVKNKAAIEQYLRQDCAALFKLVSRFYEKYGQKLTQAGAALSVWENDFGKFKRRWGGAHDTTLRPFYYGGRCQAFQKGYLGNDWYSYDIKSAYPWAMTKEHSFCHLEDFNMHTHIKKITPQSFAIIRASNRGCLPTRGKYVTEYLFHDDPREYFATGWEILAGLKTNTLKIFDAIVYTPSSTESMSDYVNKFYAEKLAAEKSSNKVDRLIAKIFMNSLYGKFGQNASDFQKYKIVEINDRHDEYDIYLECDSFDIVKKQSGGQFFDVALSASITGCVRAALFEQMFKVKNLAYMDTDNLKVQGNHDDVFELGENLGQWEREGIYDEFYIAGKKLYTGVDRETGAIVKAHKGFSDMDIRSEHIIAASLGAVLKVGKNAPSINAIGNQRFFMRTIRST